MRLNRWRRKNTFSDIPPLYYSQTQEQEDAYTQPSALHCVHTSSTDLTLKKSETVFTVIGASEVVPP